MELDQIGEGYGGDARLPVRQTVKEILELALPFAAQYIMMFSVSTVATIFVGRLGTAELSGFGAATFMVNCIGFASITGLVLALDTLLPQAYGMSPTHPMIAVYVQRCFCFLVLWCVVIGGVLLTIPHWLTGLLLPHDPEAASYAGIVVQVMVFALPFYALFEILQGYLAALNRAFETLMGSIAAAVFNVGFLHVFVGGGILGFVGAPISWLLSIMMMSAVTIAVGRWWTSAFASTWNGVVWEKLFTGWGHLLSLAFPAMAMMLCEWSAFEVNGMVAARLLSRKKFAAFVVLQNMCFFVVPTALGFVLALGILVGNKIGAGCPLAAWKLTMLGYALMVIEISLSATALFLWRFEIAELFTRDPVVIAEVARNVPFVILTHAMDMSFAYFANIVRAHGRQTAGMAFSILGYYVVGLPFGWYLASTTALGVKAFWLGLSAGQACGAVACFAFLLWIPWEQTEQVADALDVDDLELGDAPQRPEREVKESTPLVSSQ